MTSPVALVTGITGQDGSYLTELLLSKGYTVHGLIRRSSTFNTERLDDVYEEPQTPSRQLILHYADLTDGVSLVNLLREVQPTEVYNLGAQSHVKVSFETPLYTAEVTALGAMRLLEAIKAAAVDTRYFQASSSEMYGSTPPPQTEESPFHPRSPYGVAKVFAHHAVVNYREAYDVFAVNGIMFNHESPRRGETFVTRKITRAVARINAGLQERLYLGNMDAYRDWGYAPEYVEAMWRMLQQDSPVDYVIATGSAHTVREFCELAFQRAGVAMRAHVAHDQRYERPAEVSSLCGDASLARERLGWSSQTGFHGLVDIMVDADAELLQEELAGRRVRVDRG